MFKRIRTVIGVGLLSETVSFFVAGRPISHLIGYFRAGAATTVVSVRKELVADGQNSLWAVAVEFYQRPAEILATNS